jgi:hypothetical protein
MPMKLMRDIHLSPEGAGRSHVETNVIPSLVPGTHCAAASARAR